MDDSDYQLSILNFQRFAQKKLYKIIKVIFFLLFPNFRQSYDVDISINIPGTSNVSTNSLDLKNPFFRYTGQQPQQVPGTSTQSPTDAYWSSLVTGNILSNVYR